MIFWIRLQATSILFPLLLLRFKKIDISEVQPLKFNKNTWDQLYHILER